MEAAFQMSTEVEVLGVITRCPIDGSHAEVGREMVDVFAAVEGRDEEPGGGFVFDVEVVRVTALHVAHEVRDGVGGAGFEDPMAMVVEEAPAVDGDLVEGGVFADEVEGFGEVLGVAVNPLALVAALGDGVELLGAEVAQGSHGSY